MPTYTDTKLATLVLIRDIFLGSKGHFDMKDEARFDSALEDGLRTGRFAIEFFTQTGWSETRGADYSSVTLYAGLEFDYSLAREECLDDEGNMWAAYQVQAEVNWSALGSTHPTYAMKYGELIAAVSRLAERILKECTATVWTMYRSAADITKDRAEAEAKKAQAAVDAAEPPKYMRVGHTQIHQPRPDVPNGMYTTKRGEREYTVEVNETYVSAAIWRRVA